MQNAKKENQPKQAATLRRHLTTWIVLLDMVALLFVIFLGTELGRRLAGGQLTMQRYIILVCLILAAFCVLAIVLISQFGNRIVKPILGACTRLEVLGEGRFESTTAAKTSKIREIDALQNSTREVIGYVRTYMNEIDAALERISGGDLSSEITTEFIGDFIKIKESTNAIIRSLNVTLSEIKIVAGDVLVTSEQISASSEALAQGAAEQASAVEELLATINGISDRVDENARHADSASSKAGLAREQITTSNQQMKTLIGAMNEINSTSNQVATIIKIIEDIAFQTNILALNAAVEAARAGVNGKSFAVVADEVKNLATKSAAAADDTTKLIQDTITAVENGMRISNQTADLLSGVVSGVDEVADLVSNISAATAEENLSIKQVVQGLDQVSTVVQSNSATAEESAAVSHLLDTSAKHLQDLVGGFRLNG